MAEVITPYDDKIGIWYFYGGAVAEKTIDQIAQTILTYAPAVNAVYVKTSDGSDWMAEFETDTTKRDLWIDGVGAVERWVRTLQKYGLEFHAWCVPRGKNLQAETEKIIQVCQVPGVRSMILDIEPYPTHFWAGGRDMIRPYMMTIRGAIPGSFHISMSVDPRSHHYNAIFPQEWYPFVNSILPQVYWVDFERTYTEALTNTYNTWGNYGRPIFPILHGYDRVTANIEAARRLCLTQYKAPGMSYWMFGKMGATHFAAINKTMRDKPVNVPPGGKGEPIQSGTPITVTPSSPNYQDGVYDATRNQFTVYQGVNGAGKVARTDQGVANLYAIYDPKITRSGWYKIEAYITSRAKLTGNARYKIHGIKEWTGDWVVSTAQSSVNNGWVTLGTFELDAGHQDAGMVFLNDWTFEIGREVVFDAIRWTPVSSAPVANRVVNDVPYRSQEDPDAKQYRNECGVACVAMVIDYVRAKRGQAPLGKTLNQLASETNLARNDVGLFVRDLEALADKYGLDTSVNSSLTMNAIVEQVRLGRPPIMLIRYGALTQRQATFAGGHFVVVVGFDDTSFYLNDPDWFGTRRNEGKSWRVPRSEFEQAITSAESRTHGLRLNTL
jgi:hypothetical protein